MSTMLAVDLGAESGRVSLGHFDGDELRLEDVRRFANVPVNVHGRLHWNTLSLFSEVRHSLADAAQRTAGQVESLAVDGWGIDFALVDRAGRSLSGPVHYRDSRTAGLTASATEVIDSYSLFQRTGSRPLPIDTLHQLFAMALGGDPALSASHRLLFVPDLFRYWLSGEQACEYTMATTSQCFDIRRQRWDHELVELFGIPSTILRDIVQPGTSVGSLTRQIADDTGLSNTQVIAPAAHDTASAVVAIPFEKDSEGAAFISCGTWAIVGVERTSPVVSKGAFDAGLSNEGGAFGTVQFLRNVMGLWLLQECRRTWVEQGADWSYQELVTMAATTRLHQRFLDTDADEFLRPGAMPDRVRAYCARTGQNPPGSPDEVVGCILESLAMRFRATLDDIELLTGNPISTVHLVGGGARNALLCQWTANATGRRVLAGPVEAATIGNLLVQAVAMGHIGSLAQARQVARNSTSTISYEPRDPQEWQHAYARYRTLTAA
ncbi:rhamnulokinase family protein [Streptomyces sp. NPDC059224]|uniref:rhamnulokinase n=1 Tax=Streptomyces sp. NPDC059224 TaxID=3346775 RepID=UPI0036A304B9